MFSVATIFILAVTFSLLCYYFRNYIRTVRLAFKLRGPKAYPIIGHCYLINRSDELAKIGSDATQFGPIGKGWISFLPLFFIYHPRHLKIILGNNKLSRKNFFYTFLHNFVGEGLITNNDFKWKNNRKLIQPYFAINVLESFVSIFAENARETLEILDRYNENVDIKISSITNECVVNILHQAVLGISIKDKSTLESSPFRKGRTPFTFRIEKPWLLLETIFRYTSLAENESIQKRNLQNFAKNILNNRLEDMSNGIKGTNCLLNTLIEIADCNKEFTQEDIINEACTFMLAGQDSVGSATAFTLYFLAKYQDVQAKVYDEIKTACGDKKPNENIQIDHLNNMKYLEQCIKETLRLAPSIPIVTRSLTEDVKLDDYVVPRGTNLSIAIFATHRLAEHFPNPLKFDPDRFSPENVQNMHPYAFLPFSLGARNCIGYKFAYLEIKTVIATILEKYRVVLSPGKEKLNLTYKVTLRSKGGICVRLHKR